MGSSVIQLVYKSLIIFSVFFLVSSIKTTGEKRTVFGVRVAYQSNGDMITLVVFKKEDETLLNKKILTSREFSFYASGEWPSLYNPNRMNFFLKNNVDGGVFLDSITRKNTPYCFSLDSLWKLRYKTYPFRGNNETGWSQEIYSPSSRQKRYLFERYNMDQIDGKFFIDTSFWKLLRDVRDANWISTYKAL